MKNKDTEPTNQKRGLVLLVSFLLLFPIAWLHMRVAGVMVLSAFITLTTPVLVTMSCAAIYLYFSVSGHVRKLYYERFRWIPWIYNVLYYLIFWGCYGIQYTLYLRRVRTEEGYLFTSEGAFYSYVYKVFPVIILCHFLLILMRWLVRFLFGILRKKNIKMAANKEDEK